MLSTYVAGWLARRNIHYGWVAAATTFLTMLATAGAMGSAGVMIQPLHQEFGWDIATISSAMALRLVLFGLLGPFAAAFHEPFRRPPSGDNGADTDPCRSRPLDIHAGSMAVAGTWGVVIGVGTGMTALVLGATVATAGFRSAAVLSSA